MKTQIIIHKLISRTFNLVKVNQVLIMPFLIFLLLVVIVLAPIGGINPFVFVAIIALKSVFLAGWLNMFHICIENIQDESLSDEQKTLNSLNLYKEFFPGVGKYFQKIFWGILIFILIINLFESALFYFLGHFKSFSVENLPQTLGTKANFVTFWDKISHSDKIVIFKMAIIEMIFIGIFSYLTMFWTQSVIVEDKNPVNAFVSSIKTIFKDPINTFLIFLLTLISFIFVFVLNFILGQNILSQLIVFMLFAYVVVYYTMMSFLYFERYK
jgi:hypothetical protein